VEPRLYSRTFAPSTCNCRLQHLLFWLSSSATACNVFRRVQSTVDRADVVMLHANRLIKLMIDEETGLRGFLLSRNPVFLQPLHDADQQIEPEFNILFSMVRRPDQVARLASPSRHPSAVGAEGISGDAFSSCRRVHHGAAYAPAQAGTWTSCSPRRMSF